MKSLSASNGQAIRFKESQYARWAERRRRARYPLKSGDSVAQWIWAENLKNARLLVVMANGFGKRHRSAIQVERRVWRGTKIKPDPLTDRGRLVDAKDCSLC